MTTEVQTIEARTKQPPKVIRRIKDLEGVGENDVVIVRFHGEDIGPYLFQEVREPPNYDKKSGISFSAVMRNEDKISLDSFSFQDDGEFNRAVSKYFMYLRNVGIVDWLLMCNSNDYRKYDSKLKSRGL